MRQTLLASIVTAVAVVSGGCSSSSSPSTPMQGSEGQACYPNGTCNAGLSCLSQLCVNAMGGDGGATDSGGGDSGRVVDSGSGADTVGGGDTGTGSDTSSGGDTAAGGDSGAGGDTGSDTGGGTDPAIAITSPAPNAQVTLMPVVDTAPVAFTVSNFTLMIPGSCMGMPNCGHVFLMIDGTACSQPGLPYNNTGYSSPIDAQFGLCSIPTGGHTISLELHYDDQSPVLVNGQVVSASVTVTTSGG